MQAKLFIISLVAVLGACSSGSSKKSADLASSNNPFSDEHEVSTLEWAKSKRLAHYRLIFSGNVNGQLEPCGCSVNPKGGLDRRLNFINQQKADPAAKNLLLIVDAGNSLFPAKNLDKGQAEFQKKRALGVLKGHAKMGMMVQNVGVLDFAAGWDFLKKATQDSGITFVSTNLKDAEGKDLFATHKKVDVGGLQVVVLGVSAGGESLPEGIRAADPIESLEKEISKVPASVPLVILSDLGQGRDRELARGLSRAAVIVGARDLSSLEIPYHEKNSIVVQAQLQGQQWGVMNVAWNPEGKAFYNRKVAQAFERRWQDMQKGLANLENEKSPDVKTERERVAQTEKEMLVYAPGDLSRKIVYDYRLADMTLEYAKANELSPLVRELKQKK